MKQDFSELVVMSLNKADSSLNRIFHDLDKMFSGKVFEFKKEILDLKNDKKDQQMIELLRQQCLTYENRAKNVKIECKQTIHDNNKKYEDLIAMQNEKDSLYQNTIPLYQQLFKQSTQSAQ